MRHLIIILVVIGVLLGIMVPLSCRNAPDVPAAPQTSNTPDTPDTLVSPVPVIPIDTSKSDTYSSGRWEYQYTVSLPGSKSEGYYGKLLFDDKQVSPPENINDYYQTPWGKLYWVGQRPVPFGGHEWMPDAMPSRPEGKQLLDPAAAARRPAIMMQVLVEGEQQEERKPEMEEWVQEDLSKLDVKRVRVERDWFLLGYEAVTIHDTKMTGRLSARLAEPVDDKTLTVMLDDGMRGIKVKLSRKEGATRLVRHTLSSPVAEQDFYLALRVERAAVGEPIAQEIGPGADGKTVKLKGVSRVIIRLPGDRQTGLAWTVISTDGQSVEADGQVQYAPGTLMDYNPDPTGPLKPGDVMNEAGDGIYEIAFRVVGKGKTTVKMAYHRSWQVDKPSEKTFSVTLDVQD